MDLASLGIALADFLSWTSGKPGLSNYVVFSAASGVFGSCLVILDVCLVGAGPDSALGLTHGWRRTPTIVAIWFIAPLNRCSPWHGGPYFRADAVGGSSGCGILADVSHQTARQGKASGV